MRLRKEFIAGAPLEPALAAPAVRLERGPVRSFPD